MSSMITGMVALVAVGAPLYAYAQNAITSTSVTEVPIESITTVDSSSITPTSADSYGTMTVQCWRTSLIGGSTATLEVPTASASTFSDAVCWEVFPLNGGIVSVPVTPGPNFEPLDLQSSIVEGAARATATPADSDASASSVSSSPSSSSSNERLAVVLPAALLGSIAGVVLLIFTTIYILRLRARRKTQDSRAGRWADRNSAALSESWVMKQTSAAGYKAGKPEMA